MKEKFQAFVDAVFSKVTVTMVIAYVVGAAMQAMDVNAKIIDKVLGWF